VAVRQPKPAGGKAKGAAEAEPEPMAIWKLGLAVSEP